MARRIGSFALGMISALLLFVAVTLIVAHVRSDCGIVAVLEHLGIGRSGCADDIIRVGFPFPFWEEGGFDYHSTISISALLGNSAIALGIAIFGGWLGQRQLGARNYSGGQDH